MTVSRRILHVDMDCFFVSVERRRDPSLAGRPVVVGADPKGGSGRGVVAAASYEARAYGIHSAMPIQWAYRSCPHAVFLCPDGAAYARASREIAAFLDERLPDLVQASVDEFYADLTGCERLFRDPFAHADRTRRELALRFGLPATIGLASSRLVAKVAAKTAKPDGAREIPPGEEAAFLAPLPVGRLPGVGKETGKELEALGVRRIGDLLRLGTARLAERFGRWGEILALRAAGIPERQGESDLPYAKSLSRDETFETDSEDPEWILSRLSALVEDACREIRATARRARTVSLRLRYSDFVTRLRSRTVPPTDLDTEVFAHLAELFQGLFDRRVRVRLVGVRLSNLLTPGVQFLPFDEAAVRMGRALRACDRARRRHGPDAVRLARSLSREPRSPGSWFGT